MKYVVTGGAGFVGSNLVQLLVEEGHEVTVIDNLYKSGTRDSQFNIILQNLATVINKIKFEKIDIRDYESMRKVLKNIDGVFHQAALTVVQDSFSRPEEYFDVNVHGTENIFKIANENKFKVVYASSSSVYGHKLETPISEDAERNPINPYGKTKLETEHLVEKYSKLNVEIIGLRYFNIFGIGQTPDYAGVITKFLDRINEGKAPIIFGSGSQIRDFIHVSDVAKANLMAMNSNSSNLIVNIGTGNAVSVLDLANMMINASGSKIEPMFTEALEGDIEKSHADISQAKKHFNWEPKIELQDWLKEILKK
jgi:UDP-glucose 4-epimerase